MIDRVWQNRQITAGCGGDVIGEMKAAMNGDFENSTTNGPSKFPHDGGPEEGAHVDHSEAVIRLFSQHQRWLHGYLTSLLGSPSDAEDVMQEVSVILWKEHHKFQLGTNFTSWLSVIAYHQVQKFWRQRKSNRVFLSEEIIEQVACLPDDSETQETRRKVLADCVGQLRETDQTLVKQFYGDRKVTARQVAKELGRPEVTVYKALNRVRRVLFECVNRKMQAEGAV